MKKIGIVGGLGWSSTLEYYRALCAGANARAERAGHGVPLPSPPMVIESLNMAETRKLRGVEGDDSSWLEFEAVFRRALQRLRAAGAEFAIIASNTPHMRLHRILDGVELPVISILDTTARAVASSGRSSALVLGTTVTMHSPLYGVELRKQGIGCVSEVPPAVIEDINALIDNQLYRGRIDGARERIVELVRRCVDPREITVCLACTELALPFPEYRGRACFQCDGVMFIDTMAAHVEAALDESMSTGD